MSAKTQQEVMLPKVPLAKTEKFRIIMISAIASISVVIASIYLSSSTHFITRDIGIIFGIIAAVIPITLLQLKEMQRKEGIDRHLPLFLLSLVSSIQSGSNLIQAIQYTPERNMGNLGPVLRNFKANISWGMPINEAFENFAKKAGTRMAKRVVVLLEIAYKNGGNVSDNLETIQKYVTELRNLEKERKSALQPYTYTIYISYAVFIAIAVILSSQFFTQIESVKQLLSTTHMTGNNVFSALSGVEIAQIDSLLFNMAVIESIFGGLAAGKIGSGSYVAGIKHVIVMIIIAVIAFNVI
ncbi:MAG: type II secretion system F family protein [Nitrososphaeria archaeon]|nr:type II secretion system F family protein [Nitrososphaeria archaeon]NDB88766.1 type II secretion system F family protein [Nitrososphaerota archaeon]NDF26444.1 type II secretion system F family protein [Nitrosopumilaceae archaeon]NDB47281.1 type II secretion system F family protein [Nitrososphaeria archaeon]NDB89332.1 type II secretion system F family protein [Nitrososphaerota archaeon]